MKPTNIIKLHVSQLINDIIETPKMHCQTHESFDDMVFLLCATRFYNENPTGDFNKELIKVLGKDSNNPFIVVEPFSKNYSFESKPTIQEVWKQVNDNLVFRQIMEYNKKKSFWQYIKDYFDLNK